MVEPATVTATEDTATVAGGSISIEELGLPTRITNALKNADYKTAAALAKATDKDLKNVKNLGEKSISVVDEALEAKGFHRTK
jgi:DNA-directed RNA polymerase alpha subunit